MYGFHYTKYRFCYDEYHFAECCLAEILYAEYSYSECHFAESHSDVEKSTGSAAKPADVLSAGINEKNLPK